ncbi:MAG TPA: sigma-70 family RNA polymerase sigma factor [Longimicrobiales bacterium]
MHEQARNALDDAELVRRARAGSVDALAELYARHADAVYDAALRLLAAPADAEDVLQDVFVGLVDALEKYEERGAFGAWIRRVAVRRALMGLRRERRRVDAPTAVLKTPVPDPTRRITAREAVAALPDSLRVVFVLKEVEGYSHAEIGAQLGITPRASALRLHRAWKVLRNRVGMP